MDRQTDGAVKTIETRVLKFMKKNHMADGGGVLAAVSGGADSVCLLLILEHFRKTLGIRLFAFHLNHGLRGGEADRDEEFTRALCERLKVPFYSAREDVGAWAREHKMSEEEAGRSLRYRHLEETAQRLSCDRIAVAHHRGDSAETVLLNLFRGSGLHGMAGIPPVRGRVIRPLLCLERSETVEYLTAWGETWCEDSTNQEPLCARNRVRNELIPWAEKEINPKAAGHILEFSSLSAMADEYFTDLADRLLEEYGPDFLPTDVFDSQPEIVRLYLARALILRAAGEERDITRRHLEAVLALTGPGGGSFADLPYGLTAERSYDRLTVRKDAEEEKARPPIPVFSRFPLKKGMEFPKNQYTKWFDYDKIQSALSVRTRRPGDYFMLPGGKKKTVQRYMIDEKIPESQRERTFLLAEGNHVLWVVGRRISEYYKISETTQNILEVRMCKGEVMTDKIRVLLSEEEVNGRIREVAARINEDYEGKELHLICVLKGGVFFLCELAKRLTMPVTLDFMSVSSYGGGTKSSGVVKIVKDLDQSLEGRNVLIVEDIIDSGRTLSYLIELLKQRGPKQIELCTLLDKPERRVVDDVRVKYTCFEIPDEFVVGYGLDFDQKYRNLPYIGVVEQQ